MNCLTISEKLGFVGGDLRQIRVINGLAKSGIEVSAFGFDAKNAETIESIVKMTFGIQELTQNVKTVVMPLPYSIDGENVNAPLCSEKIPISEVLRNMPKGGCIFAGKVDGRLRTMADIYGVTLADYFCREELAVRNAVPTAEGAIQLAMENTPHTINGSECLIIGNGRIGKILAKMLCGIGAFVTVAARKQRDLAQIVAFGGEAVPMWGLRDYIGKFDIIFNTAPALVLDEGMLTRVRRHCLILDLASKPGGVDFSAAERLGLRAISALSLPGRVAPDTAGDIIKDTILNMLEEMKG